LPKTSARLKLPSRNANRCSVWRIVSIGDDLQLVLGLEKAHYTIELNKSVLGGFFRSLPTDTQQ
jgi:hypothetical protein